MASEFRRLLPYVRRYRASYAVGTVCVVAAVALRFAVPYLLGDSIDALRAAEVPAGDDAVGEGAAALRVRIGWAALAMAAAAALGAAVRTASRLTLLGNSRRAVHDVRTDLFAHLARLSPAFFVRHRTGDIMSRCVNDMQNVQGLLGPVFMYLVETAVLFGVGIGFMVVAHPGLAALGLLPFPVFLYFAHGLARRVQEGSRAGQEKLGRIGAKVDESLSGHRVIKSLVLERPDRARFEEICEDYSTTMLSVARTRASLLSLMGVLASLSTLLVLVAGAPLVRAGSVSVGDLVAMVLYLGMLAVPVRTLGFVLSSLQRGAAALARIGELLDLQPEIDDHHARDAARIERGALRVDGLTVELPPPDRAGGLSGAVREDYASTGRDEPGGRVLLRDVSFSAPAGSTVGVVGPVGSGKTTLLRALARQLDVKPGQIFVDGVDLVELPLERLRAAVGMAPQDAFLFSATLADNVRFGEPTADRAAVEDAVDVAGLRTDLGQLPRGLDTMLGERGVNLSGGQRQRTSLARVVLTRPRLLLLDDTLSAVDVGTAEEILRRLEPVLRECTTIIVAHRLATVQHADQILVLEDGRVTERGTHDELLARRGYYAELFAVQQVQQSLADELGLPGAEW